MCRRPTAASGCSTRSSCREAAAACGTGFGVPGIACFAVGSVLAGTGVDFSAEERARIVSHGPWPPPRSADAGNRVDGRPEAIELGRRLFFDQRLSASGQMACASCHDPQRGFQDGRRFSRHGRNTIEPARRGAAALVPLGRRGRLAVGRVAAALDGTATRSRPRRSACWRCSNATAASTCATAELFGAPMQKTSRCSSTSPRRWPRIRPRWSRRARRSMTSAMRCRAATRWPRRATRPAAQRGLKLFVGAGRCFFCHAGPAFTNGEFADIGRPFFTAGGADPGRWGGLQQLLASPYNRLGAFSDAPPATMRARSRRGMSCMEPRHYGEFKVPGLRGLVATAPYFHDGSAATIEDVVRHYTELDESRLHADGARLLQALKLTPPQVADLAAFLRRSARPPRPTARFGRSRRRRSVFQWSEPGRGRRITATIVLSMLMGDRRYDSAGPAKKR